MQNKIHYITGTCLLVLCLCWWFQQPVAACGYHKDTVKVGMLNWTYPDSLHVTGTIWRAQQEGTLPPPDPERIMAKGTYRQVLEQAAYQKTVQMIKALSAGLRKMTPDGRLERFSLVLVETALWARFTITKQHDLLAVDVGDPGDGDLVVVTGELVLHALGEGVFALSTAVESGLVKLYGQPEQVSDFLEMYGAIGGRPLPLPGY